MKILLLTNLFPLTENLSSGIFITKRLEQYKKLGIEYVAVPVWFQTIYSYDSQNICSGKTHSFQPRTLAVLIIHL